MQLCNITFYPQDMNAKYILCETKYNIDSQAMLSFINSIHPTSANASKENHSEKCYFMTGERRF